MSRNKILLLIFSLLISVIIISGGTYAIWTWRSSDNDKTMVNFTANSDFKCSATGDTDLSLSNVNFIPVDSNKCNSSSNVLKKKITMKLDNASKLGVQFNTWLNLDSVGSYLIGNENFKWVLSKEESCTKGIVNSGDFSTVTSTTDKIELFNNVYDNTYTGDYYLYMYLDKEETRIPPVDVTSRELNLSLGGVCTTTTSIVSNTTSKINNYNDDIVEVILSNPYDHDIEASISYEDEILVDRVVIPANTDSMKVDVFVTERVIRKSDGSITNYLTVTVIDNGRETKYNTNAGFTKTVHYLHGTFSNSTNFFGQTFDKTTIKSITFTGSNKVPSDVIGSMDVSADGSGSIMAWYYKASDYTDDNKLYDFYIGSSDGLVYANPNSQYAFDGMTKLINIDFTYFDTSKVTNMFGMFQNCSSIETLDLSNFDTSKVTQMGSPGFSYGGMFQGCTKLKSIDLSSFDTSSVTVMGNMFRDCSSLTSLDLSNFDTSNVTTMNYMFYNCQSLTTIDLSNFDTSNVTTMNYMFYNCQSLTTIDLSNFNTSKVIDMGAMFQNCSSLTILDLSSFNTSKLTNMHYMFLNCTSLATLDLSGFDTSKVTTMYGTFQNCSSLISLDLSNFDTSSVTTMQLMFQNCSSLTTLDISSFNTSKVTIMSGMFWNCKNLTTLDLSNFDTSSVTNTSWMFYSCTNLKIIYVSNLWNISNVTSSDRMFGLCNSLKGAVSYDSSKIDASMANYTTGYLTYKAR